MKELSEEQKAYKAELLKKTEDLHEDLEGAIEHYNDQLVKLKQEVEAAEHKLNEQVDEVNRWAQEVYDEMNEAYSNESEDWEEQYTNAYTEWMELYDVESSAVEVTFDDGVAEFDESDVVEILEQMTNSPEEV